MQPFEFPVRIYYEDTDAEGVVYYANYLKFLERTRTEWLRINDLSVTRLADEYNIIFVVRRIEIDYLYPARLDDLLSVSLDLVNFFETSFVLNQNITCNKKMLCQAVLKLVCLDASRFKPVRIPAKIKQLIDIK